MYINSAGCKCFDCKFVGLWSRRENGNDRIKLRTRVQCVRSILLIFAAFEAFFPLFLCPQSFHRFARFSSRLLNIVDDGCLPRETWH